MRWIEVVSWNIRTQLLMTHIIHVCTKFLPDRSAQTWLTALKSGNLFWPTMYIFLLNRLTRFENLEEFNITSSPDGHLESNSCRVFPNFHNQCDDFDIKVYWRFYNTLSLVQDFTVLIGSETVLAANQPSSNRVLNFGASWKNCNLKMSWFF